MFTFSSCRSHDYPTSIKLSSTSSALGYFRYQLISSLFLCRVFYIHLESSEFDTNALVSIHVAGYPPEGINMSPTLIGIRQSKPQRLKKAVVRNWCETMQASGLSSRLCFASFLSSRYDARLNFRRTIVQLSFVAATTCLVTERQITQHSHVAAPSSVESTAWLVVHFTR